MSPQFDLMDRKIAAPCPQLRRRLARCVLVLVCAALAATALPETASAQKRRGEKARPARKAKPKKQPRRTGPDTRGKRRDADTTAAPSPDAGTMRDGPRAPEQSELADPGSPDEGDAGDPNDTGARVRTKGKDTKQTQVFDFSGLNLAGSERKPQLLYFLDRAQEELQRASLERRSFIPEMVRSLDEEAL